MTFSLSVLDHRQYIEGSYKIGSVRLSVCLFGSFLGIGSLIFSNFWHGVSNPYEVLLYRAGFFLEKKFFFFALKMVKMNHLLYINFFNDKSVYYLLCSCTNVMFMENLVPGIWAKMFLANKIAGFSNQLYLQNKVS